LFLSERGDGFGGEIFYGQPELDNSKARPVNNCRVKRLEKREAW
jgi:hypothetical protein